MHHYSRHIGDYAKDTKDLSLVEHGAYTLLLDQYYASEKPLPDDREKLYRICGAVKAAEQKAVDTVLAQFFTLANGWRHKRCDREISVFQARSEAGKKGMGSRWADNKPDNKRRNKPDNGALTPAIATNARANHEPLTNNQEPITDSVRESPLSLAEAHAHARHWCENGAAMIAYDAGQVELWFADRDRKGWESSSGHLIATRDLAEKDLRFWLLKHKTGQPPSPPRREAGAGGQNREKKEGSGAAGHPLAAPPCAEWKALGRSLCERMGWDPAALDELDWPQLDVESKRAIIAEFNRRQGGDQA